ncbi:MAG: glycoside hydrolase [Fuerstiella sp.]|nr:glycoside hydrolase [Fuerstiella sp.]
MRIVERGIINTGERGTSRAVGTFPATTAMADGSLLASYRIGSTKDSADATVELRRSTDSGRSWSDPERPFRTDFDGMKGSLRCVYLTVLAERHLIAAGMWIDRTTYPDQPIFNENTEGCLPIKLLLSESENGGRSWSPWRHIPTGEDIGPPSLTNPILLLPDRRLALSIETNKQYHDDSPWLQRVVYMYSEDGGYSWGKTTTICQDPKGRIFNWDQRAGVGPDGRLVTFTWTYDSRTTRYLNIHRRISATEGNSWTTAEDLGFADQPSVPAVLPDGRVVLAWVDRFRSRSIRARMAPAIDAPFAPETEVELYKPHAVTSTVVGGEDTGELLTEMGTWNYGLPHAEVMSNGDVLVVYYAGEDDRMDVCWVRLTL